MWDTVKSAWTLLGVLKRLLVTLRSVEKSLASLAETQRLQLKLSLLRGGNTLQELLEENFDTQGEWAMDDQDDGDFAEMERIEHAMRVRGREAEPDEDLGMLRKQWENVEETR